VADEQPQLEQPTPADPNTRGTWNLVDAVLIIAMFLIGSAMGFLLMIGVNRLLTRHGIPPLQGVWLIVVAEMIGYIVGFFCARVIITLRTGRPLLESIGWKFPGSERVPQLLLLGLALAVAVQFVSALLPFPPEMPIQKLFSTRNNALLAMSFAVVVAPVVEEVFFRGILYGAFLSALRDTRARLRLSLALLTIAAVFVTLSLRGFGSGYLMFAPILLVVGMLLLPFRDKAGDLEEPRQIGVAVLLTSLAFAFVHGAQLANSWGPLLIILIVGLVLTLVRVYLDSVAASWLLHTGYNGTLFLLMYAGTDGLRKLSSFILVR
jgi:membrane protease YdiL (CAAX protease family)